MLSFIEKLDSLLYKDLIDINKNIQLQTTLVETALQVYTERLLKIINNKEKIISKPKLRLGEIINNQKFENILKDKYKLNDEQILNLKVINNHANDHKHESRSEFIQKEIKKMYRQIIYTSAKIYNVFNNQNISLTTNELDEYFDKLLIRDISLEEKLRNQIQKDYEEKNKDKEQQIKEAHKKIEIQKQNLEQALNNLKDYNDIKEKIIVLETENANYNNLIDVLREKIAKHEADEKIEETKEELLQLLKEKEDIISSNNAIIEEYEQKYSVNPTIDVDKYNKIIYELKEKIDILENSEYLNKQINNQELLEIKRKLDRKLCFNTSYIMDDNSYLLRNISHKNKSTSRYKEFYAVINNLLQRGEIINPSSYIQSKDLTDKDKKEVIRLQMMILNLIKNDKLKDNFWRINYINGNINNLQIAIYDIFVYLKKLTLLAKVDFIPPTLKITNENYIDDGLVINIEYSNKEPNYKDYIFIIEDFEQISDDELNDEELTTMNYWIEDSIKYKIEEKDKEILSWFLKTIFGFDTFREGQFEIISHTLSNKNTIGILPTGSGKSIIYQLSSLLEPKINIVIAPTRELIKDQIRVLKERFGITKCSKITSDKDVDKIKELNDLSSLKNIFIFISPERLQSAEFRSKLIYLINEYNAFDKIILDEVHCLSEWGHDFRIPYLMVAHTLKQYCPTIKFLGLTATASKSVVKDLMVELNIKNRDSVVYNESYKRYNLEFEFNYYNEESELQESLTDNLLKLNVTLNGNKTNAALIFVKTRPKVREVHDYLSDEELFGNKVGKFYSTKDNEEELSTDNFMNNEESILVSTKAFGMGIDKPNIRATFHYGIPLSLESFYQEAGRAGREIGSKATCRILAHKYNAYQQNLINEFLSPSTSIGRLKEITNNYDLYGVDVATNFFFLTEKLDEPQKEATDTINFYNSIRNKVDSRNNSCKLIVSKSYFDSTVKSKNKYKESKPRYEKYLYILHKCGIVDNWEVKYLTGELEFVIYFDSKYQDINYIKSKSRNYILQYPAENRKVLEIINNVNDYSNLINIISAVRHWYYNNFIMTRRNQLANIYKYATQDFCNRSCSNEIQDKIDSYFSIADLLKNIDTGFSYGFENNTYEEIIKKIVEVKPNELDIAISKIESELESVENNKMKLYISLLHLRNNNFDTRNGKEQFILVLNNITYEEKVNIYKNLAKYFYEIINTNQKEILLNNIYNNDKTLFRTIFLTNVKEDNKIKKYYIPYINNKLKDLFKGGSNNG